jgi:hypothetical protein
MWSLVLLGCEGNEGARDIYEGGAREFRARENRSSF